MDQEDSLYPPLSDYNAWYYPAHGHSSDEEDLPPGVSQGNWGLKSHKGSRWIRKGKMAAWGADLEDWETEERARKRLKALNFSDEPPSPPLPVLPHLRSPSPPCMAPYPEPMTQHLSFTSFVMDKAVTHSFRTPLLDELEHTTDGLIEGEATLRRALGKLWRVLSTDPDIDINDSIPKAEDQHEDEIHDQPDDYISRAPDLTPTTHKIFLTNYNGMDGDTNGMDPSQFATVEAQHENLEKSLAALRELQDDNREYVERLQEIREGLGEARAHRNIAWDFVRESAIRELKETAFNSASG
jgi:hypothetical protein